MNKRNECMMKQHVVMIYFVFFHFLVHLFPFHAHIHMDVMNAKFSFYQASFKIDHNVCLVVGKPIDFLHFFPLILWASKMCTLINSVKIASSDD